MRERIKDAYKKRTKKVWVKNNLKREYLIIIKENQIHDISIDMNKSKRYIISL